MRDAGELQVSKMTLVYTCGMLDDYENLKGHSRIEHAGYCMITSK